MNLRSPCRPILLLLASLLLSGCALLPIPPGATPAPVPGGAANPGGTLIMALGARDPQTLDPALVGDVTSAFVVRQIFSGLVRLSNRLEVEPDLAEAWELGPDGRTYTFRLRPEARFADGAPLTADDVRYSLERAADPRLAPALPARTYLGDIVGVREKIAGQAERITGIEVLDERTLSITIDAPKSYFLAKLAHPTSFVVDRRAVERGGARWTERPNGSGPFTIERWERDRLLVLARNPAFYRQPARLDRVRMLIGAAASNPQVLYEEGDIDITSVPPYALARVRDENNPLSRELLQAPQLSLFYIGMNVGMPPFDDPKVREAFTLLLDRRKIADLSLRGAAQPAAGVLPPGMPGHDPGLPVPAPDVARARALLAESRYGGVAGLPPIVAYGGWSGTLRDVAERDLGLTIEVRDFEDFGAFLDALDANTLPMFSSGWIADYPDPENFLDVLFRSGSGENHFAYSNSEVDALLDQAAIEPDEARRLALYREAERRILADAPLIPLYHDVEYMLVKPYVRGLELTPMGLLDLATVELAR